VKKNGYALDFEETEEGIRCVAAPVYNYKQNIIAAISISGPSTRVNVKKLEDFKERVKSAAMDLSIKIGYPGC